MPFVALHAQCIIFPLNASQKHFATYLLCKQKYTFESQVGKSSESELLVNLDTFFR